MSKKTFRDLIVYEIYPTSFFDGNNDGTGDLKGITSKLKYIKDTGFNAIWLNPFYVSPFRDGGYDVADFFDVDERFGTLRDFRNLCKKAHEKGIRIFVDLVAGHASMDNPDFLQSAKAERNEKALSRCIRRMYPARRSRPDLDYVIDSYHRIARSVHPAMHIPVPSANPWPPSGPISSLQGIPA